MVTLVKEAGIPPWGARLVLQLQGALNGLVAPTASLTVASLPAASAGLAGTRRFVTDATATTFASVAAGGGADKVPVYCDGATWRIG
ncbi:MAG TPA: hypothetical protein VHZ26_15060 [Caulobacteraceae bacterium]|jgi:hypothetical protein|nr:hypothetical protein [Caulobacteraceae bacterium]